MKPHYIKHNVINSIPQNMIFYDTETHEVNEDGKRIHKLRLGWLRYVRLHGDKIVADEYHYFTSPDLFFGYVEKYAREKSRLWVISHNQHFDFNVLGGFRQMARRGWILRKFVIDSDLFILHYVKASKRVVFVDTLNYIKAKLEDMGKQIGLEKLKINFENTSDEELSEYCKRDVEILSEWFLNI